MSDDNALEPIMWDMNFKPRNLFPDTCFYILLTNDKIPDGKVGLQAPHLTEELFVVGSCWGREKHSFSNFIFKILYHFPPSLLSNPPNLELIVSVSSLIIIATYIQK